IDERLHRRLRRASRNRAAMGEDDVAGHERVEPVAGRVTLADAPRLPRVEIDQQVASPVLQHGNLGVTRLKEPALLHHDVQAAGRQPGLAHDPHADTRGRVAMTLPRGPGAAGDDLVAELRPYHPGRGGRPDSGARGAGGGPNDHELHIASYRRTTR